MRLGSFSPSRLGKEPLLQASQSLCAYKSMGDGFLIMKEPSSSSTLPSLFALSCNLILSAIVDKVFFGYNTKRSNYPRGIILRLPYDRLVCNAITSLHYVKDDSPKALQVGINKVVNKGYTLV